MPKKKVVAIPQNLEEAAEFLAKIGEEQRIITDIETALNTQIEAQKKEAMEASLPHETSLMDLMDGLFAFAKTHRNELTNQGKQKTIQVPTGDFGWRTTPPAIWFRSAKPVLKTLKSLELERFIRIKEEVDKEAMLKEPEVAKGVKGVKITQREEFVVKPSEIKVEIKLKVKKRKKLKKS